MRRSTLVMILFVAAASTQAEAQWCDSPAGPCAALPNPPIPALPKPGPTFQLHPGPLTRIAPPANPALGLLVLVPGIVMSLANGGPHVVCEKDEKDKLRRRINATCRGKVSCENNETPSAWSQKITNLRNCIVLTRLLFKCDGTEVSPDYEKKIQNWQESIADCTERLKPFQQKKYTQPKQ